MANQTNARSFGLHVLATVKEKQMADIDAKKIELLPCPFCGGAAQAEHFESKLGRWRWSIGCNDHKPEAEDGGEPVCECYGFQSMTSFATKAEAIVAWNRRAIPSLAGEAVEGLCKRLEAKVVWSADGAICIPDTDAAKAAALIRSFSSRVEGAEQTVREYAQMADANRRRAEAAESALSAERRAKEEAERENETQVIESIAMRDKFIIERDLWLEFVNQLPDKRPSLDSTVAAAIEAAALTAERRAKEEVEGRLCVNCGRVFPREWDRTKAPADCKSPDACTIDMTAEEAFRHWKAEAHVERTRAEELEKALDREIAHADELRQSATSATMREAWDVAYTSLRRARTALEAPNA